nr:hypothetical protein B0A51_07700 [Rachicladosporium sp. CCFEE 5018]
MAAQETIADPERDDLESLLQVLKSSDATSDQFAVAGTTLADLSRTSADTRKGLADHDIIKRLMDALAVPILLEATQHQCTAIAILRCLGNACYGTTDDDDDDDDDSQDFASTIVEHGFEWVHHLPSTEAQLNGRDATVSIMAVRVLNNISTLSSAVPARMAASNLDNWLIDILASSMLPDDVVTHAMNLLASICALGVREMPDTLSENRLFLLLSLTEKYACDPVHGLIPSERLAAVSTSVCNYLSGGDEQKGLIVDFSLQRKLWDLFVLIDRLSQAPGDAKDAQSKRGETLRRDLIESDGRLWDASMEFLKPDPRFLSVSDAELEAEDQRFTQAQLLSYVWLLSDLANDAAFAPKGLKDPLVGRIVQLLAQPPITETEPTSARKSSPYRLTAACQILSNVLNHKVWRNAAPLVQHDRIHTYLIADLLETEHDEYLHAGSYLLCQLARPSAEVRQQLALTPGMAGVCGRLARHHNPALREDAARLITALVRDSPAARQMYLPLMEEISAFNETHRAVHEKQEK